MLAALGALLAESFRLWGVEARVGAGQDAGELVVEGAGQRLRIRRDPGNDLIGWWIARTTAGPLGTGPERPCTSVLGVLKAVRAALDGEAGPAARLRAGFMTSAP